MTQHIYHFFEDLGRKIGEVSMVTAEKGRSFSSGCRSQSSVLMRRCSTSHSLGTTIRTSSHSTFAFNFFSLFLNYKGIIMLLNNDAVYVAVSLRLGYSICMAYTCRRSATADVRGKHGLVWNQAVQCQRDKNTSP